MALLELYLPSIGNKREMRAHHYMESLFYPRVIYQQ